MQSVKEMTKERDFTFDVARALCILEIVCFWHITNYIDISLVQERFFTIFGYVTVSVLGTFSFISGFFLKKYMIENVSDVGKFFLVRIKRFWILYFIASLLLYVASNCVGQPWFPSISNFILSLIGLSVFFQPLPATLWFMVMMMFFYLITPLILAFRRKGHRVLIAITIYAALLALGYKGWVDDRVLCYYPMYALGLLLDVSIVDFIKRNALLAILGSSVVLTLIYLFLYGSQFYPLLVCVVGLIAIIGLSELMTKSAIIGKVGSFVSYSSLSMYFFHRHFYLVIVFIWNIGAVGIIREATFPIWFAYLVVCPIIIFGCYMIQRIYDSFVQKMVGKDGRLFECNKFRTMTVKHSGTTVSVTGDSRRIK